MSINVIAIRAAESSLIGAQAAQFLTVSMFALAVYEFFITLDEEREYFWSTRFSISHALFYFNRYVPPCIILINIAMLASTSFCSNQALLCSVSIQTSFFLNLFGICIVQAILITRLWFLFPGEKRVHFWLIFAFIISVVASFIFVYIVATELVILPSRFHSHGLRGCFAQRPSGFWRVYLPSLILHTGLYVLTAYEAVTNEDCRKHEGLRKRLIRDGGVFYFIVLCSVGFTSIGSFLTQFPEINIPAIFSPVALAMISLATTCIMFSLREIMANVEPSFDWLPIQDQTSAAILAKQLEAKGGTLATAKTMLPILIDEEKGGLQRVVNRVMRKYQV